MAETINRGPLFAAGSVMDGRVETMDGPSLFYQGSGFPDVRSFPARKDGLYPGRIPSFQESPLVVLVDNIPQAAGTATLAALQNIVASTPMTLSAGALAQANGSTAGNPTLSPGIPITPAGSAPGGGALAPVNAVALDFGYTTGTTVAANKTITVPDSTLFYQGQWIYVGGAGNAGKTLPLLTQVLTLATATTITVSVAAVSAITNAPIGNADLSGPLPFGPTQGPLVYAPVAASARFRLGLGITFNPAESVCRCLSITGVSGSVGGATNSFTVAGYDIFNRPMTQTLAGPVGATTVYTTKAFKYIVSITPVAGATDTTHNYSVGLSDVYGFNLRADRWESCLTYWNGLLLTAATGFTAPVLTTPATAATGDVRGSMQMATANGPLNPGASATASNGSTVRLVMGIHLPVLNALFGTPINPVPIYGVAQV